MRLSKRGAFAIGVVALVACGGSGLAPSSSDSGAVADASDETIIITSDATLPTDGASSDSESPDSSVDGGPQTDGSVNDSAPLVETGPSCEAGTVDCNGVCVNEQTDPNHCGSCTKVCPGPDAGMGMAQCTTGTCSVVCDGTTTLDCSGTCFAPTDPDHCGGCSTVCPGPTNGNGQATCSGATPTCGIACSSGYHVCNGACEPNTDDPSVSGDPCILSSTYGVFVSSTTGSDTTGNGTPSSPYATITHGLAHLGSTTRVYVCDGTYNEQAIVTTSVSLYGGLTCAGGNWQYSAGTTANVSPASGGPALIVSAVSGAVVVEDMTFTSPNATGTDANGNGSSSIAGWVTGSGNVKILRTTFHAGNGAAGVNGGTPTSNHFAGTQTGNGATGSTGAAQIACLCPDKTTSTTGGKGGDGEMVSSNFSGTTTAGGGDAGASTPAAPASAPDDGKGGAGQSFASGPPPTGTACLPGDIGAPGTSAAGGAGAPSVGAIVAGGWSPLSGLVGADGNPGQGGGGGGGSVGVGFAGTGGGGGACGGCGGAGGTPGTAGGSSFGLLVFGSAVTLSSVTLVAGTGQNGGNGSAGEAGQGGGGGGTIGACFGGNGGVGSGGGGGGGGAGGNSVGIAWAGTTTLTINGTAVTGTITTASYFTGGTAGGGGGNGQGGTAATGGNPGLQSTSPAAPGVVAAVTQL